MSSVLGIQIAWICHTGQKTNSISRCHGTVVGKGPWLTGGYYSVAHKEESQNHSETFAQRKQQTECLNNLLLINNDKLPKQTNNKGQAL